MVLLRELNAIADGIFAARDLVALRPPGDMLAHFQIAIIDTATREIANRLTERDPRFDKTRFLIRAGAATIHQGGRTIARTVAAPDRGPARLRDCELSERAEASEADKGAPRMIPGPVRGEFIPAR